MKKIYQSLICFLLASTFCSAQTHYPQNFAVREGFVSQLLRSNDTLFGVGQFGMGGYRLGAIIKYKGTNRNYQDGNIPFFESGIISDIEPNGNGGWYVGMLGGGLYGGMQRSGVLHFDANLKLDTNFVLMGNQSSSVTISALKLHNNVLYAGGSFRLGGSPLTRPFLVAYNVSTNELITAFNPGFVDATERVFDIEVHGNKLMVAGSFLSSSGQPASGLAAMNLLTGALIHDYKVNGEVRKIRFDTDTAIIGGAFSQIDGMSRNFMAKFNLSNNALMPFAININSTVYDFCLKDTSMYLGGWFSSVNGVNRNGLAKINLYRGTVDAGFNISPNQNRVQCLDLHNNLLIIGGNFQSVGGVAREYLAEINLNTNQVTEWDASVNAVPEGIKFINGDPFIYGNLNFMQLRNMSGFFALDLKTRKLLNLPLTNSNFSVSYTAIAKSGNRLFISGSPTTVNGTQTDRLFAVNLSSGQVTNIGTFTGGNVTVNRLLIHNGKLYAYGLFNQVNGVERQRFAAFKLSDLSLDEWNPQYGGGRIVEGMTAKYEKIFIVGQFYAPGTSVEYRGAALNANTGAWLYGFKRQIVAGDNGTYEPNDIMYHNGALYLSGSFVKQFNPQLIRNAIIKMNEDFQLESNFNAPLDINPGSSQRIGVIEDNIVAYVRTNPIAFENKLLIYSPLSGELLRELPFNFSGTAPFSFGSNNANTIIYHDSLLYIGGNWAEIDFNRVLGFAVFDGRRSPFPPLSVKAAKNAQEFALMAYPNPAQHRLNLHWSKSLSQAQIKVMDLQGRLLIKQQLNPHQTATDLDISGLKTGVYIVALQSTHGNSTILLQKTD
jgi:hypothetical protein